MYSYIDAKFKLDDLIRTKTASIESLTGKLGSDTVSLLAGQASRYPLGYEPSKFVLVGGG